MEYVSLLTFFHLNLNTDKELKYQQGRGMDFIFILDTSASMEGEGCRQMKDVVTTILNGNYSKL